MTTSKFVAEEVNSYEDEDQIDKAGERCYLHHLRACSSLTQASFRSCFFNSFITVKKSKGHRPPSPPSHSSYAKVKTKKQMMMEMLVPANEPTQNYSEAKKTCELQHFCGPDFDFKLSLEFIKDLIRHGFQCIVSGRCDSQFVNKIMNLRRKRPLADVCHSMRTHHPQFDEHEYIGFPR